MKIPKIIGHRGACGYAPENTVESILAAASKGGKWVEFDVKLTKDNVPVLFHDDDLDRTTNGKGKAADATLADLKVLDAGSWYSDVFAGVKIPTLEEALDVILEHDLGMNLEIKPCPNRETETAEIIMDMVSTMWDDMDKVLISSFNYDCLQVAHDMAPDFKRGFLMEADIPHNWQDMAKAIEAATLNIDGNADDLTRERVEEFMDAGLPILAYTINDWVRAKTLFSWGVDGVFSDVPDVITANINTRH